MDNKVPSGAEQSDLEAPIVLTPDQIAAVAGGAAAAVTTNTKDVGHTMGIRPPSPSEKSLAI